MRETILIFSRADRLLYGGAFGCVDHWISNRSYWQISSSSDMPLRARHDGGCSLHCAGKLFSITI